MTEVGEEEEKVEEGDMDANSNYAVEKVHVVGRVKAGAALHYLCKWEGYD